MSQSDTKVVVKVFCGALLGLLVIAAIIKKTFIRRVERLRLFGFTVKRHLNLTRPVR